MKLMTCVGACALVFAMLCPPAAAQVTILPGGELICDWCGYAGLRNVDGSPKPAWNEFSTLAKG